MNSHRRESKFRIDYRLLQDVWEPAPWVNLGAWSETMDYRQACRNLAVQLGRFAEIDKCRKVIELGCGYGAGLHVWEEDFAVEQCDALEPNRDCIEFIRANLPGCLGRIIPSAFEDLLDQQPARKTGVEGTYDAVLCVDSDYFPPFIIGFTEGAVKLLRNGGTLAFHYFARSQNEEPSLLMEKLLSLGGVAIEAMPNKKELEKILVDLGYNHVRSENLTEQVLGGFADFVRRRASQLKTTSKLCPSWIRILVTGRLCRKILAEGCLSYLMIRATRNTTGNRA